MASSSFQPRVRISQVNEYPASHIVEALNTIYNCQTVELRDRGSRFRSGWTYLALQNVDVSLNSLSSAVSVTNAASDLIRQQFVLTGTIRVSHDGREYLAPPGTTVLLPTGADIRRDISADFSQYILRIQAGALQAKLRTLIGTPVTRSLTFANSGGEPTPAMLRLRRLVEYLIREETNISALMPALQAAEFEQTLLVAFLAANRNNYSDALEGQPRQPAPWQVRLVEEYIEANWDKPLSIEDIALQTGVAVRSMFWAFKKARGYSPMAFLQQVRLRHAKEMLQKPDRSTTVTAVALICGFQNLGHFARYYQNAFNELPSATLRASKGPGPLH
jgi:AraC-like DNA-binding protein